MSKLTIDQFLDYLRRSQLVDDNRLDAALAQIEEDTTEKKLLDDPEHVANALTEKGLLTPWHVHQLMKKRYKGFYLRQYKILGHLGSGGMSMVYLAEHVLMKRRVAIKVLPKKRLKNSTYLERFVREAQAIATLDHPNIVRAYDIDNEGDVHYIVMEYFEGDNLQQMVDEQGPLSYDKAADFIRQAAIALHYAHRIGIIHRDIKPGNLLVDQNGLLKILDLGLALLDEDLYSSNLSQLDQDSVLGTADYLAPEQAIDSHKVDARADVYGLGGSLYFCLTGHPPFPFGSVSKRLLAHQREEPTSILIERPDAPEDIVALCGKMMAKNPDVRQQSAMEVAVDMEAWLVRYGYAEPSQFLSSHREMSEDFASLGLTTDKGGEGHLLRISKRLRSENRSDSGRSGLKSHRHVDLFNDRDLTPVEESGDAAAGGSRSGQGEPATDDLSLSSKTLQKQKADPLSFAMNEINLARKKQGLAGDHEPETEMPKKVAEKFSPEASGKRGAPSESDLSKKETELPSQAKETTKGESFSPFPQHSPLSQSSGLPWYQLVPTWFWCLVLAGLGLLLFTSMTTLFLIFP